MSKKEVSEEKLLAIEAQLTELSQLSSQLGLPKAYIHHISDVLQKTIPAIRKTKKGKKHD